MLMLLGGLALFLFGVQLAGQSLQALLGKGMRRWLATVTRSSFGAAMVGTVITAVAQSGTMITVLTGEFVNAGILKLKQALIVALAAGIGGTLTVQLISLKLENIQYPLLALSLLLSSKRVLDGKLGQVFLAFGLLFLGLDMLLDSLEPLQKNRLAGQVISALSDNSLIMTLLGVFLSAVLLQSSNATATLGLAFLSGNLITAEQSVALIVGANIGTTVSAVTASIGGSVDARRAAVGHLGAKILGGLVVVLLAGPFTNLVQGFSGNEMRFVANAHTLFNVLVLLAVLPFTGLVIRMLQKFIPTPPDLHAPRYLKEDVLKTDPQLAYGLAYRETNAIAERVQDLYELSMRRLQGEDLYAEVRKREQQIDRLVNAVVVYLGQLTHRVEEQQLSALLHTVSELEAIADLCKRLARQPRKLEMKGQRFSTAGEQELLESAEELQGYILHCITALSQRRQPELNPDGFEQKLIEQRINHLHRLSSQQESRQTSNTHLDVLNILEQIHTGFTRIARFAADL